jgi:hypothetical protein
LISIQKPVIVTPKKVDKTRSPASKAVEVNPTILEG